MTNLTDSLNFAGNPSINRDLKTLETATHYTESQVRCLFPFLGKRLLELGAGRGIHTQYFAKKELETQCVIELEPQMAERLRRHFPKVSTVWEWDLESLETHRSDLLAQRFDTIIAINVLEHINHAERMLSVLTEALVPGGKLLLFVPAFPLLYSKLDKLYGHYRRYTKSDFRRMASSLNLKICHAEYKYFLGFFGWFWFAKILGVDHIPKDTLGRFDKLLSFFSKFSIKTPLGHSLFVVLEKPL